MMRTNPRPLPAAAVTFLLAATVAAAGCCCNPTTPLSSPGLCRQGKTIIVTLDSGRATMSPEDKVVQLSLKNRDYAQWVSPDGLVAVKFVKESPFEGAPTYERKVLKSGPPVRLGVFDYEAKLVLPDGKELPIDPRIEVVP